MPRLDFHPAMSAPAVSRYAATAPELLSWFKVYNANRPYRDHVKPFGFLLSLSAKRNWAMREIIASQVRKGRPRKVSPVKPIAPFSKDSGTIAATAFDRISGEMIPASDLQTYREAIAQYHLHPESKFLKGDFVDRGITLRRRIRASAIRYIGKEANEIDRQQVLGADSELDPDYGLSGDSVTQIRTVLAELVALVGKAGAARALRIPPGRLIAILSDRAALEAAAAGRLSTRLPVELAKARSAALAGEIELQRLRQLVKIFGLREAARQLGIDPSNLRRNLFKIRL